MNAKVIPKLEGDEKCRASGATKCLEESDPSLVPKEPDPFDLIRNLGFLPALDLSERLTDSESEQRNLVNRGLRALDEPKKS